MRSLLLTLMFIPSVSFADTLVRLQEPCQDDTGAAISNLKSCTIQIKDKTSDNVIAEAIIPATSATGCQVLEYNTKPIDSLIVGERSVCGFCTTLTDSVSADSNCITHTFRGRPTAAPSVTVETVN